MLQKRIRVVAAWLAVMLILSGCGLNRQILEKIQSMKESIAATEETATVPEEPTEAKEVPAEPTQPPVEDMPVRFSDMEYTEPDMEKLEACVLNCCQIAQEETDPMVIMDAVYQFYDLYDRFYTDLYLAEIRYSCDLSDSYWEDAYNDCLEKSGTVEAALEEVHTALSESPARRKLESGFFGEGYFDGYGAESFWTEEFLTLMEEENRLQSQYYALYAGALEVGYYTDAYYTRYSPEFAELLVELVAVRQEMAKSAGYDSYPEFAYDYYYDRDYTVQQAEAYLLQIGEIFPDLYCRLNNSHVWDDSSAYCTTEETFDYVKTAAQNMGGKPAEAFEFLEAGELCHLDYGDNKMSGAFEMYLWSYDSPFVFVSPYLDQTDKMSFAHEFGHFANDYVCRGSVAGTDVAEVHSRSMEYLSLLYGEDTAYLEDYKLADCLCTYVEQSAFALFEQRVYQLEGEELTAGNVQALYEEIGLQFGFDSWGWDPRDYVTVEHFYTNPMYIVSYVASNDVAFGIYQMEKETPGAGLAVFEQCLESSDQYLLDFVEIYGLQNPFDDGRLQQVYALLETELADYL